MSQLPRIMHLRTVTGKGGGPEKTLLNSPRFLQDRYDVQLVYIRPSNDAEYDMPERARKMGVSLVDIPEDGAADLRTLQRLAKSIQEFRPDLLHAHDYKTNVLGVVLKSWFRLPCITTLHGYVSKSSRLSTYYRIDRFALKRMDYVIAVSDDLLDVIRSLGLPEDRYSLIRNGIDTEGFIRRNNPSVARSKLGLPVEPLTIGAVGRLAQEKGFDLLIDSLGELRRSGYDVQLVIVGDGNERSELLSRAHKAGCADFVHLVGHQSEVIPFYEAFDIFALSSLREGLPNVALEAMSMEVPVVGTNVGGMAQLIKHKQSGLLIPPQDVEAMYGALKQLLDDPALRIEFAEAARKNVECNFSFRVRMDRVAAVYDKLLNRTAPISTQLGGTLEKLGVPQ